MISQRIYDRVSTLYPLIEVASGEFHFNFRCHINAYHYAKRKGYDIVSCICATSNNMVAHFINYDKKKKVYIDNTVGEYRIYHRYYLVKHFTVDDFGNPDQELDCLKKEIYNLLPWRIKLSPLVSHNNF